MPSAIQLFFKATKSVRTQGFVLGFLLLSSPVFGAWDWQKTPSDQNWQEFTRWAPPKKAAAWQALTKQGLSFADLSWEWRMAWVRSCGTAAAPQCNTVLQHGLFDRALIVRSESATLLGELFADTGHSPALRLLRSAYAVAQNQRQGQPMFIQFRILQAIQKIGGKEGQELGSRLAKSSPKTSHYWQMLATR